MNEMSGWGSIGQSLLLRSKADHNAADTEVTIANNAVEPGKVAD